jgi:hypothetical protein
MKPTASPIAKRRKIFIARSAIGDRSAVYDSDRLAKTGNPVI